MGMTHDDLARSLADHLRGTHRMVWCDVQLGPSGSIRPDVYTVDKSFARPAPTAYEIKVSVPDFRSDVTTGKWQTYLRVACGVYFACEVGLLSKSDVPAHCGLLVRHPSGAWRAAKRATLSPVTVPQDAFLKLLIDGVEREGPIVRRKEWSLYVAQTTARKQFGDLVGAVIHDRATVEYETGEMRRRAQGIVAGAEEQAARIRREADEHLDPLRVQLCAVLGLPTTADRYDIEREIHRLRESLRQHPATMRLQRVGHALRHLLAQVDADTKESE